MVRCDDVPMRQPPSSREPKKPKQDRFIPMHPEKMNPVPIPKKKEAPTDFCPDCGGEGPGISAHDCPARRAGF